MTFARVTILLSALVFAGLGAWLLVQPSKLQDWAGLAADTPASRIELRAFYGGLQLGIAAYLCWSLLDPRRFEMACAGLACILLCTAMGRAVGFLIEQTFDAKLLAYLLIELVMGAAGATGWILLRRANL